ncbi:MAG: hypothetical protein SGJ24_07535 [Chloroflexota bacterium]|nr:hypothetical protein [Chloroflexota bacterium]
MVWFMRNFPRDFRSWDGLSRSVFVLALLLLLVAVVAFLFAPDAVRPLILVGVVALVITIQGIVLFGNRGMKTTFAAAQRLYLAGDFEGVRELLLRADHEGRSSFRSLTLLGNTYRQLGDLDDSEVVLSEALHKAPNHHFPLYGFGRTLLAKGDFAGASTTIRRAVEAGAPPVVLADLGEAYFFNDEPDAARNALVSAADQDAVMKMPHRALMTGYLLHLLGQGAMPSSAAIRDGLPYWQVSAARYAHTPYGDRVSLVVETLEHQL